MPPRGFFSSSEIINFEKTLNLHEQLPFSPCWDISPSRSNLDVWCPQRIPHSISLKNIMGMVINRSKYVINKQTPSTRSLLQSQILEGRNQCILMEFTQNQLVGRKLLGIALKEQFFCLVLWKMRTWLKFSLPFVFFIESIITLLPWYDLLMQ